MDGLPRPTSNLPPFPTPQPRPRHTVPPLQPHKSKEEHHHHRAPLSTTQVENLLARTRNVLCEHGFWPPAQCGKCGEQPHIRDLARDFLLSIRMHHADNFVDKVGTHAVFDAMDALAGTYDDDGNTPVKNPAGFVRWYIETDSEAQS